MLGCGARFELGQERLVRARPDGSGIVHGTASLLGEGRLDGFVIASTISAPGRSTMETLESRQLLDGGHAHIQVLFLKDFGNFIASREPYRRG